MATEKNVLGRPAQEIPRDTLGGKIRAARNAAKLSAIALAGRIGIKHQSLTAIERNKVQAEKRTLILLAQQLNADFGDPDLTQYARKPTVREIPILAFVAGGKPIVEEITDQFVSVDPNAMRLTQEVCALKVKGDSMIDQHILSGDVLICRKVPAPKELRKGTIVVVDLKGERGASVKRWEFKGETIYLYSDKYAKPDEKMPFHDWEVGKVFEILGLTRSMK